MIEELKENIEQQIEILREISDYSLKSKNSVGEEARMIDEAINSLKERLKIINDSIPDLLSGILSRKFEYGKEPPLSKIGIEKEGPPIMVTIKNSDKKRFLKELKLSEDVLKKIKKNRLELPAKEVLKANKYFKFSNKVFLKLSSALVKRGYFETLAREIKQANLNMAIGSYVSGIFLSTTLALIASFLAAYFVAFNLESIIPAQNSFIWAYIILTAIPVIIVLLAFLNLFYYPKMKIRKNEKEIEKELPFVISKINLLLKSETELIEVFKVIASDKNYSYIGTELRNIINYTNIYKYSLSDALNISIKTTPNKKLRELFEEILPIANSKKKLEEFFEEKNQSLITR